MAEDSRAAAYGSLHQEVLEPHEAANRRSARAILELLFERYRPASVLDVGCGLGTWLSVAKELGAREIVGVEGAWLDRRLARIPAEAIRELDLEKPFDLGRRFDLAISLEVGEHLPQQAAESFVASIARHADVVLFSAAIPFQGGTNHVNEQFPDYWRALFEGQGYAALDIIRPDVWDNADILVWLRQNIVVFAREALTAGSGPFAGLEAQARLSMVHPELYLAGMQAAQEAIREHQRMLDLLAAGKSLSARRNPDGTLTITVTDPDGA